MNKNLLRKLKKYNWTFRKDDFGLFTGKSGCSLALYIISNKYKDDELHAIAEKLLQETLEEIPSSTDLSIDKGVLGVAMVVNFLIQNGYVEGDADDVLNDIDALLYKRLKNDDYRYGLSCTSGLICFLVYLVERLGSSKSQNSLCFKINEASLRTVINKLGQNTISQFANLTKDTYTSIINDYPILFFYLGKAIKLNVYSDTICNMVNTWIMYITSYLPYYNINRLYLVNTLAFLNQSIKNDLLSKYIQVLIFSIDTDEMYKEIDRKILNINEGFFFVEILLWAFQKQFKDSPFEKKAELLHAKLKKTFHPLYTKSLNTLHMADSTHFINNFLGVETLKVLYPFLFE